MGPVIILGALLVVGAFGETNNVKKPYPRKEADKTILQRQLEILDLFRHINEPLTDEKLKTISETWSIGNNAQLFANAAAVKQYISLSRLVPKDVPFNALLDAHNYEARTLFNVLFSAKDYETFYKSAVYSRERSNAELFVNVVSIVIINREDTAGISLPPVYEIFPNFFFDGQIMTRAQMINVFGKEYVQRFKDSTTYLKGDSVVIRLNNTFGSYYNVDYNVAYFTHDYSYNTFFYNKNLQYPSWLASDAVDFAKDRRGERFWFINKQMLARYNMERLSNGLDEIPELGLDGIENGYNPGLIYYTGIPFSVRPNYVKFDYPEYKAEIQEIEMIENRIRDAVEMGFIISDKGEKINIRKPEAIEMFANLIEANPDSPNIGFYKDFISKWKNLLSNANNYKIHNKYNDYPPPAPGVMQYYQTIYRDPAFFMIWRRVLNLFNLWKRTIPPYTVEELEFSDVQIQKVELDKLVTFFDYVTVNITNGLYSNGFKSKSEPTSVLVEAPRLNHKPFSVRVNIKSSKAQKVFVRFFLAPKYNSKGYEYDMYENTDNFFLYDQYIQEVPAGESVIEREAVQNIHTMERWIGMHELSEKIKQALNSNEKYYLDKSECLLCFPENLLLPKGRVEGMDFRLLVAIHKHHPQVIEYRSNFDAAISYGTGTGATVYFDDPYNFPLDRPMSYSQIKDLPNFYLKDVKIYHKKTKVVVPGMMK